MIYAFVLLTFLLQSGSMREYTTSTFRLRYERGLTGEDVKFLAGRFEETYQDLSKEYDIVLDRRIEVRIVSSALRLKAEAKLSPFSDGVVRNDRIYIVATSPVRDMETINDVITRVVMSAMWGDIQTCPRWLAAAYALYAGNAIDKFEQPAAVDAYTFEDLSEEFLRADNEKEVKEVYAKLAATADYLVHRYGEGKFKAFIMEFKKSGITVDEAVTTAFGDKITDIEKGLVKAFRSSRTH